MRIPYVLSLLGLLTPLMAQMPDPIPTDPHAADRQALLKVYSEIEGSINSQSLERMAAQMDPQAVVVWGNGEVSRGPKQALDYYDRMLKGKDRILEKYTTKTKLAGHARWSQLEV